MNALPNASDLSSGDSAKALQMITASLRDLPRLIQTVRTVYREQERSPQHEPAVIHWIERYVRFYQTKPLGMLDGTHVSAFLTHLARRPGITPSDQTRALDAIRFFHEEVLQTALGEVTDYKEAPHARRTVGYSATTGRPLWEFAGPREN